MLRISELAVVATVVVTLFLIAGVARLVLLNRRVGPVVNSGRPTPATKSARPVVALVDESDSTPVGGAVPTGTGTDLLERLEDAFDHIDHAVVVVDGSGVPVFTNVVAHRLRDSRDGGLLVHDAMRELLARAVEGVESEQEVELFGPPKRTFIISARPLTSGQVTGAVATAEDVTMRRRTDSVRRDFVANISHELKSPVAAMGLLAETISGETDPEVVARLASRIVHEAERMGNTIDDLLVLANIEFAEDARFDDAEIETIVADALERVAATAEQAGTTVDPEIGFSGSILCDRRQLVSALHNLIDNAIKYSPPSGHVGLVVRRDQSTGMVEFVVTDEGPGIPTRDQDRVFERFYRVDRGRSRETGGTGLGLAIVRHVADNHGGDVDVESQEGVGSTFTLRVSEVPPGAAG